MGEARPATVAPKRAGEARSTAVASTAERARVATVIGDGIASHPAPGSPETEHWFSNPTELGGPRAFLVVGEAAGSVEVLLPVRPNGRTGWLPASAVSVSEITVSAEVDLSERRLRVWDGSRLLVDTAVVVGKPSSPTPLGRFYVRDIIDRDDVGGPYGPHILALSGFSEALDSFMGAEPVIALHGTNKPHLVGHDRSNGCVRIPNEIVAELASLAPLGMPVTIVA
jgi:lipoprotein-anchoring transpeptidase ErfK/SrfK